MKRPGLMDQVLNVLITLAVVALAAVVVRRELYSSPAVPRRGDVDVPLTRVSDWDKVVTGGLVLGGPQAPVQVVVFEDLECPFCKRFHESVLLPVLKHHQDSVTWVFVHYPLTIHRFARQAAQAVECASDVSKAVEFIHIAFEMQDSIGLLGWGTLASRAGIRDTVHFDACARSGALRPRIERGLQLGQELGVTVTPTVMVNGLQFASPPSKVRLMSIVDSLLTSQAAGRHGVRSSVKDVR